MSRDWHEWYSDYDDPGSSLSRRLGVVREQLADVLGATTGPVELLSLCAGDARDTVPVLAKTQPRSVRAVLVELDPALAERAREAAAAAGVAVEVRIGDAGLTATWRDVVPVDVLMLCGVFGNVADDDARRTVAALPALLNPGGTVIWTRGNRVPQDPSAVEGDPADWLRGLVLEAGLDEVAFVRPADASFRVGVHRWPQATSGTVPERLFAFV